MLDLGRETNIADGLVKAWNLPRCDVFATTTTDKIKTLAYAVHPTNISTPFDQAPSLSMLALELA
jgi:hypothetical protein